MMRSVSVLMSLVLLWIHGVEPQGNSNTRVRVCGSALANMVNIICDSKFATKKSSVKHMDSEIDDLVTEPYWSPGGNTITDVFLDRTNALRLLKRFQGPRRVRHDRIAEECCRKSCSIDEMSAYCNA